MLTAGSDVKTGTDKGDVFFAATDTSGLADKETLTSLDNIDGGAGRDTLNILSSDDANFVGNAIGVKVSNVETVNLTSTTATTLNTTTWTGLETLNVNSTAATTITAAATTDVNELASINSSTITGGKDVTINHTTAGDVTLTKTAGAVDVTTSKGNAFIGSTGAADVLANYVTGTVKVDMSAKTAADMDTVEIDGGTTIAVTATSAVSLADRTAHTDTAAADVLVSNAAGTAGTASTAYTNAGLVLTTAVTGLNAMATTLGSATTIATNNAATLATMKAGFITQAEKVSIDAAFAAALTATGGTAIKAQAATLAVYTPIITTATATEAAALVTLNAAKATTVASAAVVTADGVINTAVADMNVTAIQNTALASATIKGNTGATNLITDASAANNTLKTVTLDAAGTTTATGLGIATVNMANQESNVTINNNTAIANTMAVNIDTVKGSTLDISTGGNTATVNLAATGTNTLTLTATDTTALNISGAGDITVVSTSLATAAVVNASTATGDVTMSVAAGQTYAGGSGVDTITVGATEQAKAVDGGAGSSDTLVIVNHTVLADAVGTTTVTEGYTQFSNFEVLKLDNSATAGVITVDMSKFTNSTIGALVIDSTTNLITATKVTATQAANVTVMAGLTKLNLGVLNADAAGQIDTVHLTTAKDETVALGSDGLTLADVEILKLTSTTSGQTFTLSGLSSNGVLGAAQLTGITMDGAGNFDLTTGNTLKNTNYVIDATAVTGTVKINASGATDGAALTIKGSLTNTNNITSGSEANETSLLIGGALDDILNGAAGNDTIHGAEGNNTIVTGAGTNTVTVGNGHNTITGGTGVDTITAGNGFNTIVAGAGNDIITVGTGGNTITGGAGADTITFGAHVTGVVDSIVYTATGETANTAVVSGTTALTTANGFDIITGMQKGDTIDLTNLTTNAFAGTVSTSIISAGTNGDIALVKGNYDLATGVFTASSTGTSSILQWDNNGTTAGGNIETIVLVGFNGTGTSTVDGLITLA